MPTTTKATAQTLAAELLTRGLRAEVFPADPPHTKVDAVNIWHDPADRYPSDTVWEPFGTDGWEWGHHFQHHAPADTTVRELADTVLSALTPRD